MLHKTVIIIIIGLLLFIPNIAQDTVTIADGETVNGNLQSGVRDRYHVVAESGDVLLISLLSEDFDAYLVLMDQDDNIVTEDDDSGQRTNALINGFLVPEDEIYTIHVTSYDDTASGSYILTLLNLPVHQLRFGQDYEGTLNEQSPGGVFRFSGEAGDLVVAYMTAAESANSTMEITDASGSPLVAGTYIDDDHTRVGPIQLPDSGDYMLTIGTTGPYVVNLRKVDPTPITIGGRVSSNITPDTIEQYFVLEVPSTQVLDFVVDSRNQLDTKLDLFGIYMYSIGSNDNAGNSIDPALTEVFIAEAGTYYVVVSPAKAGNILEGSFTLIVSSPQQELLSEKATILDLDENNSFGFVEFEGVAGEPVRIVVDIEKMDDMGTPYLDITQNGESLATINMRGLNRLAMDLVIPLDGIVNMRIEVYSEARFSIVLERDPE